MREKAKYDLEERTAKFGEMVIDFAKTIQSNVISVDLSSIIKK